MKENFSFRDRTKIADIMARCT